MDWQDNILFGIILFSVLVNFNLTCGIWAFQIIRYRSLGPSGSGLRLALAPRGLDIAWGGIPYLGLVGGLVSPFF